MTKPGAVAVLVTNTGQDGTCRVVLDKELGLKPGAAAVDGETGKAIERVGEGAYAFPVKRHDCKLVQVLGR